MLWGVLAKAGWLEIIPIQFVTFADVGLPIDGSDREVWRFAQDNKMIILTDNRNMKGEDSLERVIREENSLTSLPVLTIANVDRIDEKDYRERCAEWLLEVAMDLENYRGIGRLFIP